MASSAHVWVAIKYAVAMFVVGKECFVDHLSCHGDRVARVCGCGQGFQAPRQLSKDHFREASANYYAYVSFFKRV